MEVCRKGKSMVARAHFGVQKAPERASTGPDAVADALAAHFRRSDFLKYLVENMDNLSKEGLAEPEVDIAHLDPARPVRAISSPAPGSGQVSVGDRVTSKPATYLSSPRADSHPQAAAVSIENGQSPTAHSPQSNSQRTGGPVEYVSEEQPGLMAATSAAPSDHPLPPGVVLDSDLPVAPQSSLELPRPPQSSPELHARSSKTSNASNGSYFSECSYASGWASHAPMSRQGTDVTWGGAPSLQVPGDGASARKKKFKSSVHSEDPLSKIDGQDKGKGKHSPHIGHLMQSRGRVLGSILTSMHIFGGDNKTHSNGVFLDADAIKDQVRAAMSRPQYNVHDFYNITGIWQTIARSQWFEGITLCVILANAVYIPFESDYNTDIYNPDPFFQVAEHFFCAYFVFEWVCRFMAFKRKVDGLRDAWFVFDTFLMFFMVLETWIMVPVLSVLTGGSSTGGNSSSVLKLLRLARMVRMGRLARLLREVPELTVLIKGILIAARSVFFTLCLLGIIIYIFAIAFRQLSDGTPIGDRYFRSVPESMKVLILSATLPDVADLVDSVGYESIPLAVFLLTFILLGSLTLMNMLVGVLVEVVSVVSAMEKEELKVTMVKQKLLLMLAKHGPASEDMWISKGEFEQLLTDQQSARVMVDVGVDPIGLVDCADYVFKDSNENGISFMQFIGIVMNLRGTNRASVKDVVDLRRVVCEEFEHIGTSQRAMTSCLQQLLRHMPNEISMEDRHQPLQPLKPHRKSDPWAVQTSVGSSGGHSTASSAFLPAGFGLSARKLF